MSYHCIMTEKLFTIRSYTLYIHLIYNVYTLYIHYMCIIHTVYTLYIYALYTFCIHVIHILYTLYIHSTWFLYTFYMKMIHILACFGRVPEMCWTCSGKVLGVENDFFPKSFGGVWGVFWHHRWCLRKG